MALDVWVVCDHPKDHAEACVARRWVVEGGTMTATSDLISSPELDGLREELRLKGLTAIPRSACDDPVIIESWV